MAAGTANLTIEQGATYDATLTVYSDYNADDLAAGRFDLTGYTARAQIRKKKSSADAQLAMTTANGMITLGGALGTIAIHITAANTALLNFNTGVWDLELVRTIGDEEFVIRLVEGTVTLSKEVTK